jgi:hypothetical protein
MRIRWKTARTDEPLWPSAAPVVMVVNADEQGPSTLRGWALGSPTFARAPEPRRKVDGHRDVLAPGGTAIFQKRCIDLPLDEEHPRLHVKDDGVYRINVATGVSTRAGFEPLFHPDQSGGRTMAPAPGAEAVVILDGWTVSDEPRPVLNGVPGAEAAKIREAYWRRLQANVRIRLSLATFDGAPARELATIEGGSAGGNPQWSPDGRLMALNVVPSDKWPAFPDIHVFDTTTWQVIARLEDAEIVGSASWGPDSDRLLAGRGDDFWVQHLNGHRQPITVLPEPDSNGILPAQPLGMADNDHLLTLRAPRDRATLMRTSITDGTHEGIVTWEGGYGTYPVLAQMPPETWA